LHKRRCNDALASIARHRERNTQPFCHPREAIICIINNKQRAARVTPEVKTLVRQCVRSHASQSRGPCILMIVIPCFGRPSSSCSLLARRANNMFVRLTSKNRMPVSSLARRYNVHALLTREISFTSRARCVMSLTERDCTREGSIRINKEKGKRDRNDLIIRYFEASEASSARGHQEMSTFRRLSRQRQRDVFAVDRLRNLRG